MYKFIFFIALLTSACTQHKEVPVYWRGENSYKKLPLTKSVSEFQYSDDELLDLIDENIFSD